ncbi:hypothetical protein D9M71_265280 [compost metagenome]
MVDPGLAPHRGIHLGQQRGRHLDEIDPALVAGGGEAGHVADHPATQGDQGGLAVMPRLEQLVEDQLQGFPVLERLPVGQDDAGHGITGEGFLQAFEIERRDRLVGDDRHLPAMDVRREEARIVQQPFADVDRIAAVTKIDVECAHETPRQERGIA